MFSVKIKKNKDLNKKYLAIKTIISDLYRKETLK